MADSNELSHHWIAKWRARDEIGSSVSAFDAFLRQHGIQVVRVGGGEVIRRKEFYDAVERQLRAAEARARETAHG